MQRTISLLTVAVMAVFMSLSVKAQEKGTGKENKQYSLSSERLNTYGKELDSQILSFNKKIEEAVKKYNLYNTKDIRILPYQTDYNITKDYIEIEKHVFIKSNIYKNNIAGIKDIVGIKTKNIKIYTNGQTISKIESKVFEKYFNSGDQSIVYIVDPSPTTEGTDDITFTHIFKGKKILENKKLGDIKNTTASPLRNDIKRDFLVPHLNVFYNSILFIAEAYYSSLKDADQNMSEFLKESADYQ